VKRCLLLAALAALLILPVMAHDIITTKLTYTRDVSRIFQRRCISCHGPGSSIPLTSYDEVRPWAVAIKEQVLARSMPPWGAVKGFANLAPDDSLTQEEILIIAAWVVGGAPHGNTALLPAQKPPARWAPLAELSDALVVSTRQVLTKPLTITGIRPQAESKIDSVRITARLPSGQVEPLLWLYGYDPKWPQTFRFSKPLRLPRGTLIEATGPVRYCLETQITTLSRKP